jgi:HAD superfamily hydrolase (TIGR01509 family)
MRAIVEGELGRPLPEDFAARDAEALRARFGAELRAIAGAASLLDDLALPVCIASSSLPDRLALTLALTRLDGYFAGTVFSGVRVARGKPAPDIFLLAAREMGADPSRTLVVEDSVAGVRAGRAAGMSVVGFLGGSHCGPDHGRWLTEAGAHHLVADFIELRALFPASAFVRRTARA